MGGIPKSAREQKGNKRISGVYSRRLGGRANLESDKHAGKPGAFATLDRFAWCRSVARLDVASAVTALARPAGPAAVHLLLELVLDAVVAARREGVQAQVTLDLAAFGGGRAKAPNVGNHVGHVLCVCMVRVRTTPHIFGTCVRASELWCTSKPIFEESPDGEHPFAPKRLQNLSLGKTRLNVHGSPKYFRGLARLQQGKSHDFTVEEPPGPFKV